MRLQGGVRRSCGVGAWAVLAFFMVAGTVAAEPPRQPVERFARLPLVSAATLSPDGRQLAVLMNHGGRSALVVQPTMGGAARGLLTTDNREFSFNWVRWVSDERLLVSTRHPSRRGFARTVETRLVSIKSDGTDATNIVGSSMMPGSKITSVTQQLQDQVIDWLPGDGRHVLLSLVEPGELAPGVVKLNVESGRRLLVKAPEKNVRYWMTDQRSRVRVGVFRHDKDDRVEIRACDPEGKDWRTLWTYETDADRVVPLGFGADPQELYIRAYHEGRLAVFSVRLDDPTLARQLKASHPQRDVLGGLVRSPLTGEVIGLSASDGEADEDAGARAAWWDGSWRAQLQAVDRSLPGRDNQLVDMSRDEQRYVVVSGSSRVPDEYYVGDRSSGALTLIGGTYPDLDKRRLSGKRRVVVTARDGLKLEAFLTLPQGREPGDGGAAMSMVLLPHGGPHSRDDAGFDAWSEFLADRGHAVLQVNFRGSDGYGHQFKSAGLRRWGLEMQDDLTDSVAWAVGERLADPSRVCIVGASYGGYAALMGVVKTPELYRCAISFAGVADLPDLIAFERDYVDGVRSAEKTIGKAWADRERLRATSPARQADKIRVPVLLVHGSADRRVPVEQSRDMASALESAGKPFTYLEQEGGDHHLSRYEHRLQFFKAMEVFLDQNLKPKQAAEH
jgi:dipeptidyl aminopeptidase/acylaminoacyl peptidase